jgi:ESCRT-I complex subunit TSG101
MLKSRPAHRNIPNLLDTPADLILPQPSDLPVPPVPPNPEKDQLLQSLGVALFQQRQASQSQSQSSLHSLEAHHNALSNATSRLQGEIEAMEELSASLTSNEKILKASMQKADQVMADAQRKAVPRVDEVLVAPTTVATQLYDLVAEERAIGDAIFILARAMDKGRVGMDVFLKVCISQQNNLILTWLSTEHKEPCKRAVLKKGLDQIYCQGNGLGRWLLI